MKTRRQKWEKVYLTNQFQALVLQVENYLSHSSILSHHRSIRCWTFHFLDFFHVDMPAQRLPASMCYLKSQTWFLDGPFPNSAHICITSPCDQWHLPCVQRISSLPLAVMSPTGVLVIIPLSTNLFALVGLRSLCPSMKMHPSLPASAR